MACRPIPSRFAGKMGARGGIEACRTPGEASNLAIFFAISRQDHARLCRRAGDHRRQHGFCLSRLRGRLGRRRRLPQQRGGSRSGAQHRPRADLVSRTRAILCRDRQGRGRQGRAAGRSQPEGRHRPGDEGNHQSRGARPDHAAGSGIHRLHQDLCRHRQGQEREHAGGAEPAHARRHHAAIQARRYRQQRRGSRLAGRRARCQAGWRRNTRR